jgi:hypothetical protein
MNIAAGHLDAIVHRDDRQTITVELRETDRNLSVGYVQVTLVPRGARVEAWNADDSDVDGQLVVHAEVEGDEAA